MDNRLITRALIFLFTEVLCSFPLLCQREEYDVSASVEQIMSLTDDYDPATFLEELAELKESPVNLNSGDENEISRLFFLTEFQVRVLADHVRRNGNVVTMYELALLPAFDRNTVMLMTPFVLLKSSPEGTMAGRGRTIATMTASSRFSSNENVQEGIRSLIKLKHEGGKISAGLTAENDPGEPFIFRKTYRPDFVSGYLMYQGRGLINRIIIGDYSLRTGEGLIFNSNRRMGSWLSAPSFMSGRTAAVPYSSSEENSFFRGISLTIGRASAGAVIYASSNMIDAHPLYDSDSTVTGVSSLTSGGIHVSESQREARNCLQESVAGLHLAAGAQKIRGGVTSSLTWFSLPFLPDTSRPEYIHSFAGSKLLNISGGLKAGTGPLLFFTEAAMSFPGSIAFIAGFRAKPSDRITLNVLTRHFSPEYHAFHDGACKARSGSGNETGISASLHLEAARHLFLTAAADNYHFPWPRYRSSSPSYGSRIELRGEYAPTDDMSIRLTFTSSAREYDVPVSSGTALSEVRTNRLLSFLFSYDPSRRLSLTARASASFVSPARERGYLLCHDLSYSFQRVPLRLWFRYALCTTGSFDSRLYAWENDMLSSFSIPALWGECSRTFLMLSWKPSGQAELRVKYGFTLFKEELSNELIQELKVQVRMVF